MFDSINVGAAISQTTTMTLIYEFRLFSHLASLCSLKLYCTAMPLRKALRPKAGAGACICTTVLLAWRHSGVLNPIVSH